MKKPSWYREPGERLMKMYGRMDLQRIASIHRFLREKHGVSVGQNGRSSLLRDLVEVLYQWASKQEGFEPFENQKESHTYLKMFDLVPGRGQDAENFKGVIASEDLDASSVVTMASKRISFDKGELMKEALASQARRRGEVPKQEVDEELTEEQRKHREDQLHRAREHFGISTGEESPEELSARQEQADAEYQEKLRKSMKTVPQDVVVESEETAGGD